MSAVTLGLTTRPASTPADQGDGVIPTCETLEKSHRTVPQGLKPSDSQARIVGAKAPTHKTGTPIHKTGAPPDKTGAPTHKDLAPRSWGGERCFFRGVFLIVMMMLVAVLAPR